MQWTLIISSEQIHHSIHCISGEGLCKVFDKWGSGQVMDGDCIEWLEVINKTKQFAILLECTEPARMVSSHGWLIDTRGNLVLDNLYDISSHSRRNRNIL